MKGRRGVQKIVLYYDSQVGGNCITTINGYAMHNELICNVNNIA